MPTIQTSLGASSNSVRGTSLRSLTTRYKRRLRLLVRLLGEESQRFYKKQLQHDIAVTTTRRTGKLRRVRVRKRTTATRISLIEDFPRTSFSGRRAGQYAYVVNAPGRQEGGVGRGGNRKFISHAKGVTNANLRSILSRVLARVISNNREI